MQEMQETQVWSLGSEDPLEEGLEEGTATQSSIPVWRTHGQRSTEGYGP